MAGEKTRRDFLRDTALMTAGALLAGSAARNAAFAADQGVDPAQIRNYNAGMRYRRLGKTDMWFSEISLGGHWRNRDGSRFWNEFSEEVVPDDVHANRTEVVDKCIELGINYVDLTTPAECLAYGAALKGRRDAMFVGADNHMLGPRNPGNITVEKQIFNCEECIRQLGFDYLDIWRIQSDMGGRNSDDDVKICVEAFHRLHEQGKVGFLGFSCHNRDWLKHLIETFPEVSMVVFPYTAKSATQEADPGHGADQKQSLFPALADRDVGSVCIKPFGGGSLFRKQSIAFGQEVEGNVEDHEIAQLTLAYIVSNPYITCSVPGMTTVTEVVNNAAASKRAQELLKGEASLDRLNEHADRMMASLPHDYQWLHEWVRV